MTGGGVLRRTGTPLALERIDKAIEEAQRARKAQQEADSKVGVPEPTDVVRTVPQVVNSTDKPELPKPRNVERATPHL